MKLYSVVYQTRNDSNDIHDTPVSF